MNRTVVLLVVVVFAERLEGGTVVAMRTVPVAEPTSPIEVFLDLTTDRGNIATIGARLTFDAAKVTLAGMQKQAGLPSSWSFIYQDSATAGQVDIVLTDQTAAAATLSGPATALPAVKLTFSRIGLNCTAAAYGFNAAPPGPGAPSAAFPQNQYIIYIAPGGAVVLEGAGTTPASGPPTGDHGFIRGNVNNRGAHALDISDVIDVVSFLFGGFVPPYDCVAAFDVNNDGAHDITDIVVLVQAVFGSLGVTIAPPNSSNPGAGIPGVAVPDGGTIPSILGCSLGERCL